jgi:hypothetical protein
MGLGVTVPFSSDSVSVTIEESKSRLCERYIAEAEYLSLHVLSRTARFFNSFIFYLWLCQVFYYKVVDPTGWRSTRLVFSTWLRGAILLLTSYLLAPLPQGVLIVVLVLLALSLEAQFHPWQRVWGHLTGTGHREENAEGTKTIVFFVIAYRAALAFGIAAAATPPYNKVSRCPLIGMSLERASPLEKAVSFEPPDPGHKHESLRP